MHDYGEFMRHAERERLAGFVSTLTCKKCGIEAGEHTAGAHKPVINAKRVLRFLAEPVGQTMNDA